MLNQLKDKKLYNIIMFEPLKDWEGLYEINRNGDIKTIKRQGTDERLLKSCVGKIGYKVVGLYKNGKGKTSTIHRLLGKQYIENPNGYELIDHIDRNKLNNDLSNLRWVNYSINNENRTCKGYISIDKQNIKEKEYIYYRACYRKTQKRFKTNEEAIEYLNSLIKEDL